jgi:hypothetical protein
MHLVQVSRHACPHLDRFHGLDAARELVPIDDVPGSRTTGRDDRGGRLFLGDPTSLPHARGAFLEERGEKNPDSIHILLDPVR